MPGALRAPGAILLVSCYELGHQPLAVASAAGFLERAGFAPDAIDIAVDPFDDERVARARLVAISVPMHTALRLGARVAERVRARNPGAHICLFGLYASLNAGYLLHEARVADSVMAGELEGELVALAEALDGGGPGAPAAVSLAKLAFPLPSRDALPPLDRYAKLADERGERLAGHVEASRGCLHLCRHCPIPPVYEGRFFIVPEEVVLADIGRQVEAGATHITFGDPDFLNGPGHALAVLRAAHAAFPHLTFDFTAKIEHILERREIFPELGALGCIFMVSAVESLSSEVLRILEKGHTRADVFTAAEITRDAGIPLRPSLVPFTPWATLDDFIEVLDWVERDDLVEHVDPVQYSIRLLVPPGSLLADDAAMRPHLRGLDQASFMWRWVHPDPRMDELQREIAALVERSARAREPIADTFAAVRGLAGPARPSVPRPRPHVPHLTESWFC